MAMPQRAVRSSASPERRRFSLQVVLSLALFAAAIGLSSYLLLADDQARAASSVETRVRGLRIDPASNAEAAARRLASAYLRTPITLLAAERRRSISRDALGVEVDVARLAGLIQAARDPSSPLRRLHATMRGTAPLVLPIPARLTGSAARSWLGAIADELAEPARGPRVDLRRAVLIPARPGRTLDVEGTLDALDDALFHERDSVNARFEARMPPAEGPAPTGKLDLAALHGTFESPYAVSDHTRAHNLRTCARSLDGVLVAPTQVFDFRAQVAEALATRRFRAGPVALDGPDAIEAALAQVAGTLHAAALLAGLPIIEHAPLAQPTPGLELGFDTTISRRHNLRFKNDLGVPIALGVEVRDGRVRGVIRGAAGALRDVELERVIDDVEPYEVQRRDDPTLARGTALLAQRGVPGLRVLLVRRIRDPHAGPRDDERMLSYAPRPQIVRVGTGPARAERAAPRETAAPELVIDEYVGYRMRRGFELPEVFARRPGRTGLSGWTLDEHADTNPP